tara:strand:+ start:208 stop:531 length:324 start_codon:yes stop_codon:yes gene_type:complete
MMDESPMTAPQTDAPTLQERLRKITANPIYLSGVPGTTPGNVIAKEAADALDASEAVIAELVAIAQHAQNEWESWVRDQLEGTSGFASAIAEVHEDRAALAKAAALK